MASPISNHDQVYTNYFTPITFNILSNDTDLDNDIDTTTVDLDPNTAGIQKTLSITEGIFSADNSGIVTFTPDIDFSVVSAIFLQYTVSDTTGFTSNISNITVGYQAFRRDISVVLPGVNYSSVGWADYNGDSKPDFLLTGESNGTRSSKLYVNTGSGFIEDTSVSLPGTVYTNFSGSSVGWADYNGDSKPDFLFTASGISKLYQNQLI